MRGIFRAYDIRGNYPGEFNEHIAHRIGTAFAGYLRARHVVVGRDMRLSSPALAWSVGRGMLAAGVDVTDIGIVSTPQFYHVLLTQDFDGGAMVTGSHLPAAMNGLKLCRKKAVPLSGERGLPEIEAIVREDRSGSFIRSPGRYRQQSFSEGYIDFLAGFMRAGQAIDIAADGGNGMIGPELVALFDRFPAWRLRPLHLVPDGRFPHHVADPLNLSATKELQALTTHSRAQLGVAFDGDGDRCVFFDEKGERVPPDLVTALLAARLLREHPGATILYDLRSSRIVPETVRQAGGRAVPCRIGHSFVTAAMRREKALFAGELSGSYYFQEAGGADNALLAVIRMAGLIAAGGRPLSALAAPLKKYAGTGELSIRGGNAEKLFAAVRERYRGGIVSTLDGLTVEYDDWWFNLRTSRTGPFLRLTMEARNRRLLNEKRQELLAVVRQGAEEREGRS